MDLKADVLIFPKWAKQLIIDLLRKKSYEKHSEPLYNVLVNILTNPAHDWCPISKRNHETFP
jgi:hypothetical protein